MNVKRKLKRLKRRKKLQMVFSWLSYLIMKHYPLHLSTIYSVVYIPGSGSIGHALYMVAVSFGVCYGGIFLYNRFLAKTPTYELAECFRHDYERYKEERHILIGFQNAYSKFKNNKARHEQKGIK